ncbi:hypothetical protein P4B35_05530 [Pontiellaceae bacterium B12227]|nr:hypothetical protein [Pontiellaceae bacterium B12227]
MKKKLPKKTTGVAKGAPSGFVISLMVHAAAFLLAGMLVVFTVHQKEEKKFVPPKPVDRPKMKLKKPKVKVKKSSKPKSTTRIVTKVKRASMPDIQLPEMSGLGEGLGGGIGGFDIIPDLGEITPFGAKMNTGSELKGTFYNFNRNRRGSNIPMAPEQMIDIIYDFLNKDWRPSILARYYRSPESLYTPTICVPTTMSELAPEAFGMDDAEGYCWGVHYKGTLVYPEDIRFRFWGVGDKVLAVNVDGKTVLICAYRSDDRSIFSTIWQSNDSKDNIYYFGEHRARPSEWIDLKAGEAVDLEIFLGDTNGGLVYHMLSVEVEGEEYPMERAGGGPTFPVFKTSVIPRDMQDVIYANLYPGDATLTNGPVFNDFASLDAESRVEPAPVMELNDEPELPEADYAAMRVWTSLAGKEIEAKFRVLMGQQVILESARRKQIKFPLNQLSPEDREFIEFASPPKLDINFFKKSTQVPNPPVSPWVGANQRPLQIFDYTFGTRVKQTSSGAYNRKLFVEYTAVGEEVDGDNYVLLDRGSSEFLLTEENKRSHEIYGEAVRIMRIAYRDSAPMRGTKYGGYLVTVKDERGNMIAHDASHDFLYENLSKLKKLRPNNHFNKRCERVIPARPTEDSRGPGAVNGN